LNLKGIFVSVGEFAGGLIANAEVDENGALTDKGQVNIMSS
jgi:hypothetical protein